MGEKYAWASPEAVGHLTMSQLLMYLKTDKQMAPGARPAPATAFKNKAERDAYIQAKYDEIHNKGSG